MTVASVSAHATVDPVSESTVTFATDYSIKGVPNPRKIQSAGDWLTSTYLWGRLVRYGEVGSESGDLAQSWRRSPDGLEWVFKLQPNAQWSDGSPMTAAEVVVSLKESISGTVHTNLGRYVREISVVGTGMIQFKLSKLPENFLFSLACPDFSITDPGKSHSLNGEYHSVRFSGPYRAIRSDAGMVELERNLHYAGPHSQSAPQKVLLTGAKDVDQNIASILESKTQILSITDDVISVSQDQILRASPGVGNYFSSPDWTVSVQFGKEGMKRLTSMQRRWLQRALWMNLHDKQSFGSAPATGIRPVTKLGGVSVVTMEKWMQELPGGKVPPFDKPLEFFVRERFAKSRSLEHIERTFQELKVPYRLTILGPKSDEESWKRVERSDFDLILIFQGVADPDPDSAWRYMMEYYPGAKRPVTLEELDLAMLERDRSKRAEMYRAFEKRVLDDPFVVLLRMASSRIAVRKPWLPPEEGQFEWGVQLWMFRRE